MVVALTAATAQTGLTLGELVGQCGATSIRDYTDRSSLTPDNVSVKSCRTIYDLGLPHKNCRVPTKRRARLKSAIWLSSKTTKELS